MTSRLLNLPPDLLSWLQARARYEGRSVCGLVRWMVERYRAEQGEVGTWK